MSWKLEDHTADVRLCVEAPSWVELLAEATRGFGEFVGGEQRLRESRVEREVEVAGSDAPETWVRFWRALHRLWSVEGLLPLSAHVEPNSSPHSARARVRCVPTAELDLDACEDVKAVTWHSAEALQADGLWRGRVVLDL